MCEFSDFLTFCRNFYRKIVLFYLIKIRIYINIIIEVVQSGVKWRKIPLKW